MLNDVKLAANTNGGGGSRFLGLMTTSCSLYIYVFYEMYKCCLFNRDVSYLPWGNNLNTRKMVEYLANVEGALVSV